MYFSTALAAGAFVLQVSAFLVPLEVDTTATTAADFPHADFWSSAIQTYELDCPGCPFPTDGESTEDVENRIHLEFRIDDQQKLRINDVATFPFELVHPLQIDITVPQIRASDLHRSKPVPISFAFEVLRVDFENDESDKKLIEAKFTILDLNSAPVKVDTVKIDLLEIITDTGRTLAIAKISSVSFDDTPGATECTGSSIWSLCRLRAIIAARLHEMIEGAKQRASTLKDWVKKPGCKGKKFGKHGQKEEFEHQYEDPSEHDHEHHMHRHHMLHRFGHMLHQAIRFFIVPALLGVIGGLMASAVGMMVGQLIVFMWFRFHRNGQRGQVRMEVALAEEEKDSLMDEPPHYEDLEERKV